jgi:hypothetical protein
MFRAPKTVTRRVVAGVLAAGLTLAASGTAYADPGGSAPGPVQVLGSNGQQVRACDDSGLYYAVRISGTSHSGSSASTMSELEDFGCHSFDNWWFVGLVTLKWYMDNSTKSKTTYCNVPKVQSDNWVVCFSD